MRCETFDDPEPFRGSIAAASAELMLVGGGAFHAELSRVRLPGAHVQSARANLPHVLLAGVTNRAVFHVGAPAQGEVWLNGRRLLAGELALCPAGGEVHVRTEAGAAWNTLSFALHDFDDATTALLGAPVSLPRRGVQVVRPDATRIARLLRLRGALMARRADGDTTECQRLQAQLLEAAASCVQSATSVGERLGERRAREIVAAFQQHATAAAGNAGALTEICAALDVPARTLNTACRAVLGISAAQYLRRRRLHVVRRALLSGSATVTEAATEQGFWELGRFAASYRAVFGEPPSATARRSRGRAIGG